MAQFIEVTMPDRKTQLINVNAIESVISEHDGTVIRYLCT